MIHDRLNHGLAASDHIAVEDEKIGRHSLLQVGDFDRDVAGVSIDEFGGGWSAGAGKLHEAS